MITGVVLSGGRGWGAAQIGGLLFFAAWATVIFVPDSPDRAPLEAILLGLSAAGMYAVGTHFNGPRPSHPQRWSWTYLALGAGGNMLATTFDFAPAEILLVTIALSMTLMSGMLGRIDQVPLLSGWRQPELEPGDELIDTALILSDGTRWPMVLIKKYGPDGRSFEVRGFSGPIVMPPGSRFEVEL